MNTVAERPSIQERVGQAIADGDLEYREGPCSLDKVMALGLAGMREEMADAVYRLKYGNESRSYHDALRSLTKLGRILNAKENWRMEQQLAGMAKAVLEWWLVPTCPVCVGRKAAVVTGTPMLEDAPCDHCGGSGRRPLPWLHKRDRVERAHTTLLVALEESERRVTDRIVSKLGAQLRVVL